MAYVFKVKLKSSCGNCPKGYEMQITTSNNSSPNQKDLQDALTKAGFKSGGATCTVEVIK